MTLSEVLSIDDKITSGVFVNKIFYFTTKSGKINLSFLGKSLFLANAEKKQFILGALPQQQRIYLFDRNNHVYSHHIPFELFDAVYSFVSGTAKQEPEIPSKFKDRVAKYYHAFDLKREAYKLTENQDHKFELSLQLGLVREGKKYHIQLTKSQFRLNQPTKLKLLATWL
jgi:coatomer subunit beta'